MASPTPSVAAKPRQAQPVQQKTPLEPAQPVSTTDVHDRDVATLITTAAFTPGARDIPVLLDLLQSPDDDQAALVQRALLRLDADAMPKLVRRLQAAFPDSVRPARARLVQLAGHIAKQFPTTDLGDWLRAALADSDLKTQLSAIQALGRLGEEAHTAALLACLAAAPRPEVQKALVRALGQSGAAAARQALADLASRNDDQILAPLLSKADLILNREISRSGVSRIADERINSKPVEVWLRCRLGAETELRAEALAAGFAHAEVIKSRPGAPCGRVRLWLRNTPLRALWKLRLLVDFVLPCAAAAATPRRRSPPASPTSARWRCCTRIRKAASATVCMAASHQGAAVDAGRAAQRRSARAHQ